MDRYEEALERAKEWEREHPNGYVIRDMMEHIFPGYNESEDERTRKELIHFILYKAGQLLDEETEHKFIVYLEKQKEQKPVAREKDFVSKPKNSVEILKHYLTWATSEEENCPYSWKELADAIRDGIKALEEQKPYEPKNWPIDKDNLTQKQQPAEWSEEDEKTIKEAIHRIEALDHYWNRPTDEKLMERLKSLRPHWKPSKEQN